MSKEYFIRFSKNKYMSPLTIIFVGAMIAIVGGIITGVGTYLQNISSSEKSAQLISVTEETKKKVSKLETQNQEQSQR